MLQKEITTETSEVVERTPRPAQQVAGKKPFSGFPTNLLLWLEFGAAGGLCLFGLVSKTAPVMVLALNGLLLFYQLIRLPFLPSSTRRWERWLLVAVLLLMLLGSFSGLQNAFDKAEGYGILNRLLAGFSLFLVLWRWLNQNDKRPPRLQLLAIGLVLSGVGLALVGLLGAQWNTKLYNLSIYEKLPHLNLLGNINSNLLAGALVVIVSLPVGLAISLKSWLWRLFCLGAELILLAVLFLTQSRTAWVAGGVSLGFFGLLALLSFATHSFQRRTRRRVIGLTLFLVMLVIPLALVITDSPLLKPLKGRAEVWKLDLRMVEQFPLTGTGFANFRRSGPLFFPYFLDASGAPRDALYSTYSDHVFNNHAHNLFLQVWLDLGIVGLVGFAGWMGWLGWRWLRFLLLARFNRQTALAYAFAAGAIAFLVQSLADASLWTDRGGLTGWPVLAGLTALPAFYHSSKTSSEQARRVRKSIAILVMSSLVIASVTLLFLNLSNLSNFYQRNSANLSLQRVLLSTPVVATEPYADNFGLFVAKFYTFRPTNPDRADLARASSFYRQAVQTHPSDAAAWRYLALTEAIAGDDTAATLEQILKIGPPNRYAAFIAGLAQYWQGDYAGVVKEWQQSPNAELYLLALATSARTEAKDLTTATRDLKLSLEVRPTALTHQQLAEIEQSQGQPEAAMADFQAAIRLEPDNFIYYQQLGILYLQTGRKVAAAATLKQGLILSPNNGGMEEFLRIAQS